MGLLIAAQTQPLHALERETEKMKTLLCSRVAIVLALVVALAVTSGAWLKWD